MRGRLKLVAAAALVLLAWGGAWAGDAKISPRYLSPQDITDYALPAATQKSAGLTTVGIGTPVYLEALADSARAAAGTQWTLTSKPSGSAAALATSPLGGNIPMGYAGEEEIYRLAGRQLLVPDKVGQYVVTAVIGDTTVTATITGATYVGVGTIDGASPSFPQCALCHAEQTEKWATSGHSTMLQEGVDGIKSPSYSENCISCHTVGFDKTTSADNGGFDDVLRTTTWGTSAADARGDTAGNFFKVKKEGNFASLPAALKAKANIQCENCHGPGSEHKGDPSKIATSIWAGNCAQCHESGTHHYRPSEWQNSRHAVTTADPTGPGEQSCVVCHTGAGFIERVAKGLDIMQTGYGNSITDVSYSPIGCASCHEPHTLELRTTADVTLMNGEVITEGGEGKLCMNCHKTRRNGPVYANTYHSRQNPHYGVQADMLAGTNGPDYGDLPSSTHLYAVENSCATCHMQTQEAKLSDGTSNPAYTHAGGHTFNVKYDNGTSDKADDIELTEACANCHGPTESFDMPRQDFDGDGVVEGVQTEVTGLMEMLAKALPPVGQTTIKLDSTSTVQQNKAAYAYYYVYYDGSHGIHNTRYTVGMLKAAIKDLTGRDVATAVETELVSAKPRAYALAQNHPNPFNPETAIRYSVPEPASVRIEIYNSLGQRVRTLVDAHHATGEYAVQWDGRDAGGAKLTAGVYIYTMRAGTFVENRKMVLLP
ncbi:MAG: FlgD immunoglobulin-like domain containing protein [Candidatus Latescibacterota bacterium]